MDLMAEGISEPRARGSLMAFRLPAEGGDARLYHLPGVNEESWRFDWGDYAAARVVGFSATDDVIYSLTDNQVLVVLDLETGRTREVDSTVVLAVIDAAERVIVARSDGSIGLVESRAVSTLDSGAVVPTALWGGVNGRVLALVEQDSLRELWVLQRENDTSRQPVPRGAMTISMWGDVAAIAVDSGLVTFIPGDATSVQFVPLEPPPTLVTFSPSGHQIHLVLGDRILTTLTRFDLEEIRRITLPGAATALRPDPTGRKLLIKQESEGLVWVANLDRYRLRSTASSWDADLPLIVKSGETIARRGDSLVVLAPDSLVVLGATTASPADRWVVATWEAQQPAHQLANTSAADQRLTGLVFYVQVSSSRNPVWAEDFASRLRVAGMTALVLQPDELDELYHVVLGPYTSRQEAETVGRSIGLPFWILTRQGQAIP